MIDETILNLIINLFLTNENDDVTITDETFYLIIEIQPQFAAKIAFLENFNLLVALSTSTVYKG